MIKASLLVIAMLASGSVVAGDNSANVSVQSKLMDHGTVVSDDTTVGLGLRFEDVIIGGLFVRSNFDSVSDVTPVNDSVTFRSDIGAGFGGTMAGNAWEVSANRVLNPIIYAGDYTEIRGRLTRGPIFVEINQGVTTGINKDTYVAAGLQQTFGSVTLGGLASTTRYNNDALGLREEFEFNNAEVFARYNVWDNMDINVNYSYGGYTPSGEKIDNQVWGGLNFRF